MSQLKMSQLKISAETATGFIHLSLAMMETRLILMDVALSAKSNLITTAQSLINYQQEPLCVSLLKI